MDPEEQNPGTDAQDATFDQDWDSALSGELPPPTGQSGDQGQPTEPTQSDVSRQGQAGVPAAADTAPEVLAPYLQRAKQAGFDRLEDALDAARNFQSIKGQLPNLQETWKKQHLTPLERQLAAYQERERQALDQFASVDPYTNTVRSPQERQRIYAEWQEEQRQLALQDQQAQDQQQQALAQQQARAEFEQKQAQVAQMERGNLKLLALNSLKPFTETLAKNYGIPTAEVQRYIDETGMIQKVQALEDMRQYGPMIAGLEDYARVRAGQLQQDNARNANANGRYRDVGQGGGGTGGQSGSDRWAKANDEDFDRAWKRAMNGTLA